MEAAKKRSKALKTVVRVAGFISVSLELEKGQIVVVGDGIDAVTLTNMLRKRMGYVEMVSVAAIEEKKEEKKDTKKDEPPVLPPYYPLTYDPCSIM